MLNFSSIELGKEHYLIENKCSIGWGQSLGIVSSPYFPPQFRIFPGRIFGNYVLVDKIYSYMSQ